MSIFLCISIIHLYMDNNNILYLNIYMYHYIQEKMTRSNTEINYRERVWVNLKIPVKVAVEVCG